MKVYLYLTDVFDQTIKFQDGTEFNDIFFQVRDPEDGDEFVGILDLTKVELNDIRRMQNRFYAMGNALAHMILEDYAATLEAH